MNSERMPSVPGDLVWLDPWEPVTGSGDPFVRELRRELSEGHALHGVPLVAVARRMECDEVLFATSDVDMPLAVVHLTWRSQAESDPRWPHTATYEGWRDWIERCLLPEHRDYQGSNEQPNA